MRFLFLVLISLVVWTSSCTKRSAVSTQTSENATEDKRRMDNFTFLYQCMQGNFSSEEQGKNDSDYFDIRLRMVPVWEKSADIFYLYVEQAMSTSLEKPYRQRFYKVEKVDDTHFVSHIYLVNNPARFTGKKPGDTIFNSITPDSLQLKDGCEVYLTFDEINKTFEGATNEKTCPSERSGATYATAKVHLNDTEMRSWDQGWSADGKQVWGATKGGYIFKKQF
jgi:CpeT protein